MAIVTCRFARVGIARSAVGLTIAVGAVLGSTACGGGQPAAAGPVQPSAASQVQPSGPDHVMVTPEDLVWVDAPTLPSGAKVALIEGQLDQPVPFTLRLRFPADFEIPAHRHPAVEHVTVLSGTINMGTGDALDKTRTSAVPTGGMTIMQPDTNHFLWTAEEATVQVHGVGPFTITYVNPADDPRTK